LAFCEEQTQAAFLQRSTTSFARQGAASNTVLKNNRAENSHQPFRRRELALLSFNERKARRFDAVHASIHDHFNRQRHLISRDDFKNKETKQLSNGVNSLRADHPKSPCNFTPQFCSDKAVEAITPKNYRSGHTNMRRNEALALLR